MPKLTNIKRATGYAMGGVVAILAYPTFGPNGVTPNATITRDVNGIITGISLPAGDAVTGAGKVIPLSIESEIEKANFSDNLTIGAGRYKSQAVGFTLAGIEGAKSKALEAVDLVPHTYLVKTRRGKYFLLGEINGMVASQNNAGSGTAPGDLNGYEVIVSGAENGSAPEVGEAAYASLAVLVAP